MKSITFDGDDNMGGIPVCRFAAYDHIESLARPNSANTVEEDPVFVGANGWLDAYSTEGTGRLTISSKMEAGVEIYDHTLVGFIPGNVQEQQLNLEDIRQHLHIVRCTDADGKERQLGSTRNRARFAYEFDSGGLPSQRKGANYRFTWRNHRPAPYVDLGSGSGS